MDDNKTMMEGGTAVGQALDVLKGREGGAPTQQQLALLESCRLHVTDPIPDVTYTLFKNGVGFAPLGGLAVVTGEAKHGKTWVMLQLMASFMGSSMFGIESNPDIEHSVLWFDTEESKADSMRNLKRVHTVCGWSYENDNPNFTVYNSRTLQSAERLEVVETAMATLHPTVLVIDGVRDLLADFNDVGESKKIVDKLMAMAEARKCCIWLCLHVNPGSDKMRGHLGTELENKANDVLVAKKSGEGLSIEYSVRERTSRGHRDIDKWTYMIADAPAHGYSLPVVYGCGDNDGGAVAPTVAVKKSTPYEDLLKRDRDEVMERVFNGETKITARYIEDMIKKIGGCSTAKARAYIADCVAMNIITKLPNGGYEMPERENEDDILKTRDDDEF